MSEPLMPTEPLQALVADVEAIAAVATDIDGSEDTTQGMAEILSCCHRLKAGLAALQGEPSALNDGLLLTSDGEYHAHDEARCGHWRCQGGRPSAPPVQEDVRREIRDKLMVAHHTPREPRGHCLNVLAQCENFLVELFNGQQSAPPSAPGGAALRIVREHRKHVILSPGVGAEVQRYALAVCDDILEELAADGSTDGR